MNKILVAAFSGMLMAGAASCAAEADVLWSVNGTFDDGGSFSGTFTISGGYLLDWDITTTLGNTLGGYHYTPGTTFQHWTTTDGIEFASTGYDTDFVLKFLDDLSIPEAVNPIQGGYQGPSRECENGWGCYNVTSGDIRYVDQGSASAGGGVPEPLTLSLVGAGLAGIGGLRRRAKA